MGKSSGPDYRDLAVQQGEANAAVVRDQTYANRPTQFTPWGYTAWDSEQVTDPGSGELTTGWSQTQGLTPELQEILNKQIAIQGGRTDIAGGLTQRLSNEFGTPMNWDGLSPLAETPNAQNTLPESYENVPGIGDPTALRGRAEDAVYNKMRSRLDPQYESKRNALEIKMRNQGLGPEDEAWIAQMEGLGQQETDAYGQASYDSIRAGLGEQSQLFNQDMGIRKQGVGEANDQFSQALGSNAQNFGQTLSSANYANQIRQQQLVEEMKKRGASLNEINALLSGQQVNTPTMPSFTTASSATPAPIYQGGVDQGNADQLRQQGVNSGLGNLVRAGANAYGIGL